MAQTLASGFSGSFAPASIALSPGATGSVTWSVSALGSVIDGSYAIEAQAADPSGGSTSAHATFTVFTAPPPPPADATAPTVSWASPSNGASLSRSATLSANASDNTGVTAVEFYDGSKLIARDTSDPYRVKWRLSKVSKGSHSLTVRALDAAGNKAEQTISVTVN